MPENQEKEAVVDNIKKTSEESSQENQTTNSNSDISSDGELKSKILELENKLSESNDKILRALAELDNQRRRSREEVEKANKYAITNFVSDLATVVENFFMASENAPKQEIEQSSALKNYALAIDMTQKELLKILEKYNVKRIYPLSQDFDHNFHEAIAHVESDAKAGSVTQVIQAGYSIGERLIRPALVSVAKEKTQESAKENSEKNSEKN